MERIKFIPQNDDKISNAIDVVQHRCRERLIDITDIHQYLKKVENRLKIPKVHLEGTRIQANPHAQHFANCYKGIPMGTAFEAEYHRGFWYITKIYRMPSSKARDICIVLSNAARAAVIKKIEHYFY